MCGIFGIFNHSNLPQYRNLHTNIRYRGPDFTKSLSFKNNQFVFHRLCINDLSVRGNQPFEDNDNIWMCNGEIYNYIHLKNHYNINCIGNSDCEIISQLYNTLGIHSLCNTLDGVFAISLYNKKSNTLFLIRDVIGVRPLYYYKDDEVFAFSSEGKSLNFGNMNYDIKQLDPGSYLCIDFNKDEMYINKYFDVDSIKINNELKFDDCKMDINRLLTASIEKRLLSDRPIGCLLSGGLDSSLVASILSKLLKKQKKRLKTFSVGFKDSEDLKYAKQVSKYLDTDHYELILNYEETIQRIPELIEKIETYDVTTIRASIGMYLLSEYISKNHSEKVIFSGEGSDEIFGGYLYFHRSPNHKSFEEECKYLIKNLHYFDVLRADRCTAAFGLELRVPFLDKEFLKYVISIPGKIRKYTELEKHILRISFTNKYLPQNILLRKKEAFSDGVGSMTVPFYTHIQNYILNHKLVENNFNLSLDELEQTYYKDNYFKHYNYKPIPHYWMPKWINTSNPSGRLLLN